MRRSVIRETLPSNSELAPAKAVFDRPPPRRSPLGIESAWGRSRIRTTTTTSRPQPTPTTDTHPLYTQCHPQDATPGPESIWTQTRQIHCHRGRKSEVYYFVKNYEFSQLLRYDWPLANIILFKFSIFSSLILDLILFINT